MRTGSNPEKTPAETTLLWIFVTFQLHHPSKPSSPHPSVEKLFHGHRICAYWRIRPLMETLNRERQTDYLLTWVWPWVSLRWIELDIKAVNILPTPVSKMLPVPVSGDTRSLNYLPSLATAATALFRASLATRSWAGKDEMRGIGQHGFALTTSSPSRFAHVLIRFASCG